ncbi:TNT domain-containing protein, partial [Leclercia adecarboxylata]|uniref:TNT domain-containing protein n=1 Tax=Leclercia adecarboxylata TaxID=83655 RepID=UPI00234CE543|nr:TNT domain-containing protein [Leclercia adecarboxylata]
PYDCSKLAYTTYRVMTPIFVWVGKAAPWFDQAGGATQFETDATAAQLVGDAALQPVAAPGPSPCKTR